MISGQIKPNDTKLENIMSIIFSVLIIIAFITFVFVIILNQWISYLPEVEATNEEVKELIESGQGNDGSVIIVQSNDISVIRQAHFVSFICFGILDSIFALLFWKRPLPKKHEGTLLVLGISYPFIRWFSAFVIIMVSIVITVSSLSPSILYIIIAIFSGISLTFILYLRKYISSHKLNADVIFEVPNEIIS